MDHGVDLGKLSIAQIAKLEKDLKAAKQRLARSERDAWMKEARERARLLDMNVWDFLGVRPPAKGNDGA